MYSHRLGYGAQGLSFSLRFVQPPWREGQHQMGHGIRLLDGFVGVYSEVPEAQGLLQAPVNDLWTASPSGNLQAPHAGGAAGPARQGQF